MANLGRVYDGVEYPLRHEACKARHRAYVQALAEGLNFTQAAHAVGVSKRTGKGQILGVVATPFTLLTTHQNAPERIPV